MTPIRALWFAVGLTALGLGALGVVLPLLPTTPFVLLAAFAFARSSERWNSWLRSHKLFGPMIKDWHHHGAIGRRTKLVAVISMAALLGLSLALQARGSIIALQAVVLIAAAAFVLSRPTPPEDE